jgi:hypothetical protein
MSVGITKTLEVISVVQDLAVRAVAVFKEPSFFKFLSAAPALFSDVSTLSSDAAMVLPELQDIDAGEVGQLGSAAYKLVVAVVAAIKA